MKGNARKVTLISYGVETAADVSAQRIKRISGFGPSMAGAIVAWRISIERKFVFDPSQPINPADIASIKAKYAKKKADLQAELRQWLTQLRATSTNIVQSREQLRAAALPVWQSLRQAELDERTVQNQLPSSMHKWGFGFVVVVGFAIIASLNNPTPPYKRVAQTPQPPVSNPQSSPLPPVVRNAEPSVPPPASKPDLKPSENRIATNNESKPTIDSRLMPPPAEQVPFNWPEPTYSGSQIPTNNNLKQAPALALGPPPEPTPSKLPEPTILTPPSLTPPLNAPPALDQPSSEAREIRSLSNREDVLWIQSRLAELGFLKRSASGNWDSFSRAALRDFKITNKMANNYLWDTETEKAVASASALKASDSFLGSWSETTPCDASVPAPMVITSKRAASSAGGFCDFLTISPENGGWRIKSRCSSEGQTWTYEIRFNVAPGQLVWDGKSGRTIYFRCR